MKFFKIVFLKNFPSYFVTSFQKIFKRTQDIFSSKKSKKQIRKFQNQNKTMTQLIINYKNPSFLNFKCKIAHHFKMSLLKGY